MELKRLFSYPALLACTWLLTGLATAGRPCEESDMCSVGVSKTWVGDIKESSQLHAMLQSVAYKKELIVSIYQLQPDAPFVWLDQVMQLHYELMAMGYAHHLFISHSAASCKEIETPGLSCVWDSSDLPSNVMGGETALWHNRWKLMARVTRLGYNMMSIDTDFIFFRDPYVHFKTPPLSNVQLICNPEGGSAYNCNGGFIYVRNVRPDGPVTWVFMEVARSSLRRGDDNFEYLSQWSGTKMNCLTFDQGDGLPCTRAHPLLQSIISDAISTAAAGRPLYPSAVSSCKQTAAYETPSGAALTFNQVQNNMNTLASSWERTERIMVQPEASWLAAAGFSAVPDTDAAMIIGELTVPNVRYGFPDALGGRTWPDGPNKPLSSAWEAMLRADCPECPWWNENRTITSDPLTDILGSDYAHPDMHKDKLELFIDQGIPQEVYGQSPMWLSNSLSNSRRGVVTGVRDAATQQGYLVLGHVHAWHMQTHRLHKTMLRKVYGRYNWTLGSEMAARAGMHSPYLMGKNVTHVLALSPDIDLSRTRSWAEFSSIMVGLYQVAHLSRRVVKLPDIPCQAAWLHSPGALSDPMQNKAVCVAPTFWREPFRYPLPLTLAVDDRGELVGGWARKLAASGQNIAAHDRKEAIMKGKLKQASSEATTEQQQDHTGSNSARGSGRSLKSGRGLFQSQGKSTPQMEWWLKQRYVAALPALWDSTCTKDMHAIISAEFFHWLKQYPDLSLEPSTTNTVLTPDPNQPKLKLNPPLNPGGDSRSVPAGEVVPTSQQPGWSWRDVQVALPASQVVQEMHEVRDQPLVYLGHPVMVVPTIQGTGGAATGTVTPGNGQQEAHAHALHQGSFLKLPPEEAIQRVNHHIQQCHCKAVWTEIETHKGTVVDLNHGMPGNVQDHKLVLRS